MQIQVLFIALILLSLVGYAVGRGRAVAAGAGQVRLHSLPRYHGLYVALWCGLPALLASLLWLAVEPRVAEWLLMSQLPPGARDLPPDRLALLLVDIKNLAAGNIVSREVDPALQTAAEAYAAIRQASRTALLVVGLALALAGLALGRRYVSPAFRARNQVERVITVVMIAASLVAILTTIGIVLSLLFEAMRFFGKVPVGEFLFGLQWSPQTALREDQVGASGAFGAVPLFLGTLLITVIAMCVAVPVGLFSAIYLSEYASPRFRAAMKPTLEILAGIPTVVYGVFAALTMAPFFRGLGEGFGLDVSSESALAAGVVMDLATHRVRRGERPVHLGPTEFKLLRHFLQHPKRVFSREQLLDAVWGRDVDVEPRTVDVHIPRLRRAINTGADTDLIRTVRSAGYALDRPQA
jgi:phosphate transport system permease protein